MENFTRIVALIMAACCLSMIRHAEAANAPAVSIVYPVCTPGHQCRSPLWVFPGDTVTFGATVTGNNDYVVNGPETNYNGGGDVQLFREGTKVGSVRINSNNTQNVYTVMLLACPISVCNPPQYLPWSFGSPTSVNFSYTFPTSAQGTFYFNTRFSGDNFTSPANSDAIAIKVSCERRMNPDIRPPGDPWVYPPAGSGCP